MLGMDLSVACSVVLVPNKEPGYSHHLGYTILDNIQQATRELRQTENYRTKGKPVDLA